ncbi:AraC family transcriptional regulator [Agriterribacter sp.]|uniref:helix-turn-helix domain-containing protein n=1 Tax=Agriterribacter sp. TaxID=2821509 RepID=UPI002CB23B5B|nr:AraC family transcriptional regulator [Agriterribacter sp.]HRO45494.1 AraC family transcriptional regulator [Agriterribacter sp.]HRQ19051.1 AraC family transcriptional regulator [Agriterribacter sp.]
MNNTYDYITSRPREFKQLAVNNLLFLHYKCPQEDKYVYVYNHFNQIAFTLQGTKTFHCGTRSWSMTEHTTHFAKKGAWKQENADLQWELLAFYFPDEFLCRFYNENRQLLLVKPLPASPGELLIRIKINDITRAFFYSVLPYFSQHPSPPESLLELKFKELLFNILSNPENTDLLAYVNYLSDFQKLPLNDIMETNFCFNLSLAEFARIAQRSVSSFKRDFWEHYHTTPGKWLTEKRLNYAKALLETSAKNVNEITYDSGFENVSHFCRVFKEKYGTAPLQFRKQLRMQVPEKLF